MSFWQPEVSAGQEKTTPSPAKQSAAEAKVLLLQELLNALGGSGPTFSSFVKGGPATRPFPSGLGGQLGPLLEAMGQPGAFTAERSILPSQITPSGMNDLSQLLGLGLMGAQIYGSGILDPVIENILKPIGGALHILGPQERGPSTGDFNTDPRMIPPVNDVNSGEGWNFSLADPNAQFSLNPSDYYGDFLSGW